MKFYLSGRAKKIDELKRMKMELDCKQRRLAKLFWIAKNDENRDIQTDIELNNLNHEVDLIGMRIIELDKLIYGKNSHYGNGVI